MARKALYVQKKRHDNNPVGHKAMQRKYPNSAKEVRYGKGQDMRWSKVGKRTWLPDAGLKVTNYWGALHRRTAQEAKGKGTLGRRGTVDPGWVNDEEGRGGGLQSKTPELGRRKGTGKGKGKGGKGKGKGRHHVEHTEARSGRGIGRRIQHQHHRGMEHTEERRSRGMERRMHYPWYKEKVPLQRTTVEGEVRWT